MTERTAHDAGAIACPFVAFVDDRDERADVPDHRHRCYAEIRPAQRAIAHQQAFCLSPAFSTCPTFQDWARRESARATEASLPAAGPASAGAAGRSASAGVPADDAIADQGPIRPDDDPPPPGEGDEPPSDDDPFDDRATRNPHRDWAAPPPWVDPAGPGADHSADPPAFLSDRSSGSDPEPVVDSAGLSASRWLQDVPPQRTVETPPASVPEPDDELERALAEDRARRERSATVGTAAVVGATASASRAARRSAVSVAPLKKVSETRRRSVDRSLGGPSWERPHTNEAYPTLKTRIGLPSIPRVILAGLALVVAAIVVFSLPFVLHLGGDGGSGGLPTTGPSAAGASASARPTVRPSPTAQVYVVKSGDTLLKIARKFGITVDQLIAANKQIKNPDKIGVGAELKIPLPVASGVITESSASPGSSPSASAAP